jgi:nucleotide-binding universal stress UspA family protein
MGNVSDSVVRHAHCPVMVVRAEAVEFLTKILVATDRSREAQLAATTAADLAPRNTPWRIFCAYGRWLRVASRHTHSLYSLYSHARLITSGRWIGDETLTNF